MARSGCMHLAVDACISQWVHRSHSGCMHLAVGACISQWVHASRSGCMHLAAGARGRGEPHTDSELTALRGFRP